jgi:hypothetical protein
MTCAPPVFSWVTQDRQVVNGGGSSDRSSGWLSGWSFLDQYARARGRAENLIGYITENKSPS